MEETAKISKAFRKHDNDNMDMAKGILFVFFWLLAFCNMEQIDLAAAVWNKYQGICPYCGAKENCECIKSKPANSWHKNGEGNMPASLDEWQVMFNRIYGKINNTHWPLVVWLHVLEELAELSEEFRKGKPTRLNEELADFFSWLVGFCNRTDINLAETAWTVYPGICTECDSDRCECPKI